MGGWCPFAIRPRSINHEKLASTAWCIRAGDGFGIGGRATSHVFSRQLFQGVRLLQKIVFRIEDFAVEHGSARVSGNEAKLHPRPYPSNLLREFSAAFKMSRIGKKSSSFSPASNPRRGRRDQAGFAALSKDAPYLVTRGARRTFLAQKRSGSGYRLGFSKREGFQNGMVTFSPAQRSHGEYDYGFSVTR
jgi:hypothetical protein